MVRRIYLVEAREACANAFRAAAYYVLPASLQDDTSLEEPLLRQA